MRKKTNQTSFAITGAAALLIGLTANVEAIPISMRTLSASQSALAFNQSPASSNPSVSSKKVNANTKSVSRNLKHPGFGRPPSPLPGQGGTPVTVPTGTIILPGGTLPKPLSPPGPNQPSGPSSVPDGGTTATMMGGVFCGLALLRKKLKA